MKKFTLLELLIVIAIIAILLTLLLPSLSKSRAIAKSAVCLSNQSQISKASAVYNKENNSFNAPHAPWKNNPYKSNIAHWNYYITGMNHGLLFTYLETIRLYYCPGRPLDNEAKTLTNADVYLKSSWAGREPTFEELSAIRTSSKRIRQSYYYNIEQESKHKLFQRYTQMETNSVLLIDLPLSNTSDHVGRRELPHIELGYKWNLIKADLSGIGIRSKPLYDFIRTNDVMSGFSNYEQAIGLIKDQIN